MVYKNGKKETLTNFEEDIAMPQVNTEGTKVVFTKNYQLYLFDIESGQIENIQPLLNNFESLQKRSEEHTSELQSRGHLVCRLLLEKRNHGYEREIDDDYQ